MVSLFQEQDSYPSSYTQLTQPCLKEAGLAPPLQVSYIDPSWAADSGCIGPSQPPWSGATLPNTMPTWTAARAHSIWQALRSATYVTKTRQSQALAVIFATRLLGNLPKDPEETSTIAVSHIANIFRSEMPRMILGFTSSFDVGELSTWILSTETSGWLGEFFQYKTTQILGVKDEELQLRLKQECAIIARCELSLLRQCCCRCRRLLLLLWRWFFRCFLRNYTYYQSISPSVSTTGTSRYYTQY